MRARWLLVGLVCGVALGATASTIAVDEPSVVLKNGVLEGWEVTRDNETRLCADPTIFIHARQIECP